MRKYSRNLRRIIRKIDIQTHRVGKSTIVNRLIHKRLNRRHRKIEMLQRHVEGNPKPELEPPKIY